MKPQRINYNDLTTKQKEIYDFHQVVAVLAGYGFNCIKLSDDWQGADFLAYHKDGARTLKVQLKGRVSIYRKYKDKDLYMCFPIQTKEMRRTWYLVPYDELVQIARDTTPWLDSESWRRGGYSSGNPLHAMVERLHLYALTDESF